MEMILSLQRLTHAPGDASFVSTRSAACSAISYSAGCNPGSTSTGPFPV